MTGLTSPDTPLESDEPEGVVPDTSRAAAVFVKRMPAPEEPAELLEDDDEAAIIQAIVRGL